MSTSGDVFSINLVRPTGVVHEVAGESAGEFTYDEKLEVDDSGEDEIDTLLLQSMETSTEEQVDRQDLR